MSEKLPATVPEKKQETVSKKVVDLLKSYVFDGFLLIALGLVMLIWPENSLMTICIVAGIIIGVMGFVRCIAFFVDKKKDQSPTDLLMGVILLAAGVALIVKSDFFISVFQYITGVILIYGAILMFAHAYTLRREKGPLFLFSLIFAIVTTALAVVILINPLSFASFITRLHGVALIIEGLSMIGVLRKIGVEAKGKKSNDNGQNPGNPSGDVE